MERTLNRIMFYSQSAEDQQDIAQYNFMADICREMQRDRPRFKELQSAEVMRNLKIDALDLPYKKTRFFQGISGLVIRLKLLRT